MNKKNNLRERLFKKTAFLLSVLMVFSLIGCGKNEASESTQKAESVSQSTESSSQPEQEEDSSEAENSEDTGVDEYLTESGLVRSPKVKLKGDGTDTTTVMIYMNGSNLESDNHSATVDLCEIIDAGSSDQVHIVVQTMGTKQWDESTKIASDHSQRYEVSGDGFLLVDDSLGQLDCTKAETLSDFVTWSSENYPADRYELIFWDHGGGSIYGFGFDEWNEDEGASLTIDEMQTGLKDAGVYFDFIGMDCCLMSSMEVVYALYDFCDYMILSEDFESDYGWSYTDWLSALYENPSISTIDLGKKICESMVSKNVEYGDDGGSILSLINVSTIKILYEAWKDFAYANQDALLEKNYSRSTEAGDVCRVDPRMLKMLKAKDESSAENTESSGENNEDDSSSNIIDGLASYGLTDIMAVSESLDTDESEALSSAVAQTLIYVVANEKDSILSGLSVTLPYSDTYAYEILYDIFINAGMDEEYVTWLRKFTGISDSEESYDYEEWDQEWDGVENYDDNYDWSQWQDAA